MMWQFIPKAGTQQRTESFTRWIMVLLEEAAQNGEDKIKVPAKALLGSLYVMMDDLDKAEEILNSLPKMEVDVGNMLPSLYMAQGKLEEAEKLDQQTLFSGINSVQLALFSLATLALRQNRLDYALKLAETQSALISLFSLNDFFSINNCNLFISIYSAMKNKEKAIFYLNEYVENIRNMDYTKLCLSDIAFFGKLETKERTVTTGYVRNNLIKLIREDPHFAFVRETEEYSRIIEKLE